MVVTGYAQPYLKVAGRRPIRLHAICPFVSVYVTPATQSSCRQQSIPPLATAVRLLAARAFVDVITHTVWHVKPLLPVIVGNNANEKNVQGAVEHLRPPDRRTDCTFLFAMETPAKHARHKAHVHTPYKMVCVCAALAPGCTLTWCLQRSAKLKSLSVLTIYSPMIGRVSEALSSIYLTVHQSPLADKAVGEHTAP